MSAVRPIRITKPYGRFRVPPQPLPYGANPTECDTLDLDDVDDVRKINCVHQAVCCTYAASENWDGYHCGNCQLKSPLTVVDHRQDVDGLATLLTLIFTN